MEPKLGSKMLCLETWERLREGVCEHVLSWTVNEPNRAVLDDPTNTMVVNINMFVWAWYWWSFKSAMAD
jgi:hypothetical protein